MDGWGYFPEDPFHFFLFFSFLCDPKRSNLHLYIFYPPKSVAIVDQDSSDSTATRYGLDGLGIESCWERDFPHPSSRALGPTQPPVQWVAGRTAGSWR
jgi:hypothetical protein